MRPPPCGGFCRLSWGCAVLRGCSRAGLVRVLVPHLLHGVHRLPGLRPSRRPPACAGGDPPWTSAPLQSSITGTPRRSCRLPGIRDDASSPGLLLPYDTYRPGGPVCRQRIPPLPRTACGVWLPPSRCPPPGLPTRKRVGAPMGFTLQGLPLVAIGTPLGARALLPLPAAPHLPGGGCGRPGRLQGLLPATSPCSRRNHKGSDRRSLLGVRPSRACSRSSWRAL